MKNIHILPTDKPSRLFKDDFGKYFVSINIDQEQNHFKSQNIYITNSEEIKEGDWFYDLDTKYVKIKQSWENSHLDFNGKKIILTTDPDLIKNGVQAIDDEFLEWFFKNTSCERVEVEKFFGFAEDYLIIIPKEYESECICDIKCRGFVNVKCKKPKQEQDKNKYSEEDMKKAIDFGANGMYGYQIGKEGYTINQIKKFLQQFKNK
jgi:hypothetical protein